MFAAAKKIVLFAVVAVGVHAVVIGGFVAANMLSKMFEEEEIVEAETTEVTMIEPEPEEAKETPPEPEEVPPPPVESFEPAFETAIDQAAPQIGISADSTVEGGTGPAFRTGSSLAGAISTDGLAQEILNKDGAGKANTKEMVMTAETVDTPPKPLSSNRPPVMPAKARQKGISGYVDVRMMIGKDGAVLQTTIVQSQPPGIFEEKVLEVISGWRFEPAVYKGQAVAMPLNQRIRFEVG